MIKVITHDGIYWAMKVKDNFQELSQFIADKGRKSFSQFTIGDESQKYFPCAMAYRDADEESPEFGQYYVVNRESHLLLYTEGEFKAKFKIVSEEDFQQRVDVYEEASLEAKGVIGFEEINITTVEAKR